MSIVKGGPQTLNYLTFDGVDDFVEVPYNSAFNVSNHLDIELTFSTNKNGASFIFNQGIDATYTYGIYQGGNNNIEFYLRDNTGVRFTTIPSSEFIANEIYTVRALYENNTMYFYKDGVLKDTETGIGTPTQVSQNIYLASWRTSPNRYFEGNIYYSKLSVNNNEVLEYDFSEGTGTTLNDSVGTNNGTIVGATWNSETLPPLNIQNMYLGSTVIPRAYLGDILVFGSQPFGAYELIADINVATATTQIDFDNLNITKDDELRLVYTFIGISSGSDDVYSLFYNTETTQANYWFQLLLGTSSTLIASRVNKNEFASSRNTTRRSSGFADIKISNNDRFIIQSQYAKAIGSDSNNLQQRNFNVVGTQTVSSINKLSVVSGTANGIAVGSRLQLYKVNKGSA